MRMWLFLVIERVNIYFIFYLILFYISLILHLIPNLILIIRNLSLK